MDDLPGQWKRCKKCGKTTHITMWEYFDIDEDKIACGLCCHVQEAGGFTDEPPQERKRQKCLMCRGSGLAESK